MNTQIFKHFCFRTILKQGTLILFALLTISCYSKSEVPSDELRYQAINKSVMCPVCPGESIDQSQHTLAIQMRKLVVEKIELGWDDNEIRDFFAARYGPSVLLDPPKTGLHIIAWIVPPIALCIALLLLVLSLILMSRKSTRPDGKQLTKFYDQNNSSDEYLDKVKEILAKEDSIPSSIKLKNERNL